MIGALNGHSKADLLQRSSHQSQACGRVIGDAIPERWRSKLGRLNVRESFAARLHARA
jgi:hypothetical protein